MRFYANTRTRKSVVGHLSGYGWFYLIRPRRAGFSTSPPTSGLTVPMGNHGFPPGESIVSGRPLVIVNSAGTIIVVLIHATTENICRTLS